MGQYFIHDYNQQMINTLFKTKSALKTLSYGFSSILNTIKTASPKKPYPGYTPLLIPHSHDRSLIIQDPELKLKFLVQQPGFPSQTDIGVGIKLGSRDQTPINSGSLNYLQQIIHNKPTFQETIGEYDFLQRSGSELSMIYDVSYTYMKMSFLPEDVDVMTDMLLDTALGEKNMYEEGIEIVDDLNKIQDVTRYIAYKGQGVGMPKGGMGIQLTNQEFLKFQQNITPDNTIFSLAGYSNYQKLMNIIKQKIKTKYPQFLKRPAFRRLESKYHGGFHAFDHNDSFFECAIVYESVPYKSPEYQLFGVLRKLIGKAESFSSGGPGKGMYARSFTNMLDKISYVMMARVIQETYDDTGLFGLALGGPSNRSRELVELCVKELKHLRDHIGPQQLVRAKNILLSEIYTNIQRQPQRLQEMTNQIFFFDKIRIDDFQKQIMNVTTAKIKEVLTRIMDTPPTIVYFGDKQSIKSAPKQSTVRQLLKS